MDFSSTNVHPHVERALHSLFKRGCVECPTTTPSCPSCSGGKVCSLIPQSCDTCAHTTCVDSGDGSSHHSGPNVGAIAGGVIGGVVLIGLAVFLFYWFVIRRRRQQYEQEWEEEDVADQKSNFNMQRAERASVHSVAHSILSRASNFIPIAYIPGVMNRDGRGDSNSHIPPVPPIPAAHGQPLSAHSSNGDALFFRPSDLRDSTYSDADSLDRRHTFLSRNSITPSLARSSIATFRDDAVVHPMPAQTVLRGKANVVSVKSSNTNTPSDTTPTTTPSEEIQAIDFSSASSKKPNVIMPTSSDSVSVSSKESQQTLGSASYAKPTLLTISKKGAKPKGRFPVSPAEGSTPATKPNVSSPLANSEATTPEEEIDASPFSDSASAASPPRRTPGGLSALIEETPSEARQSRTSALKHERGTSPFGDEHATSSS